MNYRQIIACRLCEAQDLEEVWDLGEQYVMDCLDESQEGFKAPLIVMLCRSCGLAQLQHTVNRDLMYRKYWYRSGTSETMRAALSEVVNRALDQLWPVHGDRRTMTAPTTVLDIGANDGYLLQQYPASFHRVAVDPARNIKVLGASALIRDYFSYDAVRRALPLGKATITTSVAMFYDVDAPSPFIHDVARLLAPNGVWVCQQNFLGPVMRGNAFDFISHEHVALWEFPTFTKAVAGAGLQVFDLEEVPINGGTYRVYVGHQGSRSVSPRVAAALDRDVEYSSAHAWRAFKRRVNENGARLSYLLADIKAQGRTVAVLGASTRGNSLLQHYDLGVQDLPYASDRDPNKVGLVMAGTNIPIVSEEEARARKPDYFLVLPYSYIDQIAAREKDFVTRGGRFIVPLPNVKILD